MYPDRIELGIKHNMTERKLQICTDHEVRKDVPYLAKLWGIFCKIFGKNIPRDIESQLHFHSIMRFTSTLLNRFMYIYPTIYAVCAFLCFVYIYIQQKHPTY